MSEKFHEPAFLREQVKPGPLKGEEYGEGSFTVVANLENLPKEVRKNVPEGYVVKQYKDERLTPEDLLFKFELDSSSEGWSLIEMAKKLQARHRAAQAYFGKELPNFVISSQFIVGPDKDGVGHIYEVQKKIEPEVVELPEYLRLPVDKFESKGAREEAIAQLSEKVKSLYGEKLPDVKKDLEIFIRLAQQLPDNEGWFPDLAPGNLLFTKDGFRYVDTNYVIPLTGLERHGMHEQAQEARATIKNFIQSLKDLAARL